MWRFLAGVVAALLLAGAGLFWWQGSEGREVVLTGAPPFAAAAQQADAPLADPPEAGERTREEKRFARYDKDKNGGVAREEYLTARRKAFAKLDADRDGRVSFDEYAAKTVAKFTKADQDRSGVLDAGEFATTRVVRKKAKPTARCDCRDAVAAAREE